MDLRAPTDDAALVRAAQAGDGQAFGVLFDRWSTRVVDVAYRIVRDREVAAEVAQDAFLAAWTGIGRLEQAESFGGWVLRIGRNRALNRLDRERRSVPLGDEETDMLDRGHDADDEAGDAASRSEDASLVWAAAAALGPRDASVLDLHLRHGLAPAEIADELEISPNAAHQVLFRLRNRLGDAVRACVLWRAGRPVCPALAGVVATAGISSFGADAARVIGTHAAGCADCTGRQEARLSPEALFAAIPLLVVAPEVLAAIRSGLVDAGVPIAAPPPAGSGPASPDARPPDPPSTSPKPPPSNAPEPTGSTMSRRPAVLATAAGVLVLVIVAVLLLADDGTDPEEVSADGSPTSSTADGSSSPTTDGDGSTTEAPAQSASSSSTTTGPAVSSLPAPTGPGGSASTTTTGPFGDTGTTTEPPLVTNPTGPTTTRPPGPTTTTTSTTSPRPDPPVISGFRATRNPEGTGCTLPRQRVAFAWATSGADSVTITGTGAPGGTLAPSGSANGCARQAVTYTLTASGPGGQATRQVSVPGP